MDEELIMLKLRFILLVFVALVSGGCLAPQHQPVTRFDTLCDIAEEALVQSNEIDLRVEYIYDNIQSRIKSDDVLESMEMIWQVDPKKRYLVYKGAVENDLGRSWECHALSRLFEETN